MRFMSYAAAAGLAAAFTITTAQAADISGAGATFPYPIFAKWDDEAIKKLNPKAKLPSSAIAVVHRSDGSGTTFNFTNYLNKVSPAWKDKVGSEASVEWPV